MALQSADGFDINFKVETTEGTAATGGSATGERLRYTKGAGAFHLRRVLIESQVVRDDGNVGEPRLGSKFTEAELPVELAQGEFDTLLEALLRSTWVSPVTVTFDNGAALTSLTVNSSSQVTFAGTTTPAAAGLREGDVFTLANMSNAANNGVRARVKTITGSVVDLHGTPLTTQAADPACTLTIAKKLSQAATPTKRTFTFENYAEDVDLSELWLGQRVVGMRLQFGADGMVTATFRLIGLDRTTLATGASPYFTSPTEYTSTQLVAADASITYNGSAIATLTGLTLDFSIAAQSEATIGAVVRPGSFDNAMTVTGEATGHLTDLSDNALYDAETKFALSLMLVEPESEPKSFLHFHFGGAKLLEVGPASGLGGDGAYIHQRRFAFTPVVAATGRDAGVCTISTAA